jgi:hypothetical protein
MSLSIRTANLETEREVLTEFLRQHLNPQADAKRFDWLYLRNPHGVARTWLACEAGSGMIVGASAVFPRRIVAAGKPVSGCVLGDFCIRPDFRSLGPALELQRRTLSGLQSAGFEFAYDLPSTSMLGVYKRIGITPQDSLVRMARPLRADRQIAKRVKSETVARGLSAAGNLLLELRDWKLKEAAGWTVELHNGKIGEEFSELANRVAEAGETFVHRSAEFLNWRYLEHPYRKFEILTARHDGQLRGYLVFDQIVDEATIADLFGLDEPELWQSLLARAVALNRERGAAIINAPALASHPRAAQLEALGFSPREAQPLVTIGAAPSTRLFIMDGDRES